MARLNLDFRNTNTLWCSVMAETLARMGVREAVVAPGSRSAPLAFAFAGHPDIEAIPVLDERSAGFLALGLAKARGRPVVLVCTSGTAGANFLPAVIEAWYSGVPLIVLTADRPPELRACTSGQTIDQQKLYGSYVRFHHELALPEVTRPLLAYLRQTVAHACERATDLGGGPVHLNVPMRDPLAPMAEPGVGARRRLADWRIFFSHLEPPEPRCDAIPLELEPPATSRGLIVAGADSSARPEGAAPAVVALAHALGWPVLADGLSRLRGFKAPDATVVAAYDAILRNPVRARELRPDHIIVVGEWPTSKVLRSWLAEFDGPVWILDSGRRNPDALHLRTTVLRMSTATLALLIRAQRRDAPPPAASAYGRDWARAEARAARQIALRLKSAPGLFEGRAAALLAEHLPEGSPLFVASSMPVRDVEFFRPNNGRSIPVFFNRGANGIDGTLSTAMGIAHAAGPAVLLTGDLALLHDSNGFLLRSQLKHSLTIVLINNRGGRIFEHLPIAQFPPQFEKWCVMPQEVDWARLCAAHGVGHQVVRSWTQFARLVARLPRRGVRLLELRTDGKRDAAIRKKLFAAVADQV